MMKRLLTTLLLTAMLLVSASAFADTKKHNSAKVSFWIPDNWTIEGEDNDQLQASDPKGEVALLFMVRKAKDMDGALASLDEVMAAAATDIKAGAPEKIKINGMDATVVDATGKVGGVAVGLSVVVLKTPAKKFLIILGVIQSDKLKTHEANLTKILGSLKPMKMKPKFGGH
jgi:hypothetical protein